MNDEDRDNLFVRYVSLIFLIVLNAFLIQLNIDRSTKKILESIEKVESRLEVLEPSSIIGGKNVLPETR